MKIKGTNSPIKSVDLHINFQWLSLALLLIIIALLAIWQPWKNSYNESRTVVVTGETTIKSEPDEYVFTPSYQAKDRDKALASEAITTKSGSLIVELKKIGIEDKNIKTDISSYGNVYSPGNTPDNETYVYTLALTITSSSKDQAQLIQDYLSTTAPLGSVTPVARFSETRQKELEQTARDQATQDARKKAEQNARNLGFHIGAVKTVSDGSFGGTITPMFATGVAEDKISASGSTSTSPIQLGQNELNYSITVTYYLR